MIYDALSLSLSLCLHPCLSFSAGQCEPNQVPYLKGCVKTSPGLRVMDSYAPLTEERTSLCTSLSEFSFTFLFYTVGFVEVLWTCCLTMLS